MKPMIICALPALLLTAVPAALAADRDVCPTCAYTTIQAALNAAASGDRVRVTADTYTENLAITPGGALTLTLSGGWSADFSSRSSDPSLTVVDAGAVNRALRVYGNPIDLTVESFTFRNGSTTSGNFGGCVQIMAFWDDVDLLMRDVVVEDCVTASAGGGMALESLGRDLTARLERVEIGGSTSDQYGGGMAVTANDDDGDPGFTEVVVLSSVIHDNTATNREGGGIAVWAGSGSRATLRLLNSTVTRNTSTYDYLGGGGIVVSDDIDSSSVTAFEAHNSVIRDNTASLGADLAVDLTASGSFAEVRSCDIHEVNHVSGTYTAADNLDAAPGFVDAPGGDFHLTAASALVDAGSRDAPFPGLPEKDFDGECRLVDGNADGAWAPDMGADEYQPTFDRVALLAPNGGEWLATGSTRTVFWGAPTEAVTFRLRYSRNNGLTWKRIAGNLGGVSFDWTVPTLRGPKRRCRVKVIGFDGNGDRLGADRSNRRFTINAVEVVSPAPGQLFYDPGQNEIVWTTHATVHEVSTVTLLYSLDGGQTWEPIDTLDVNEGTYGWLGPGLSADNETSKVKVILRDAEGRKLGADASALFTITVK